MKFTEDTEFANRVLAKMLEVNQYGRRESKEPHLSELIYCLTKSAWKRRDSGGGVGTTSTSTPFHNSKELTMFAIGVALEKVLFRPLGANEAGVYEGVAYEKDLKTEDGVLGEFKTTRMSAKRLIEDFPLGYYRQLLGYMKIDGTLKAKFTVLFIIQAELRAWEVEVSQEELDENWAWVQERKRVYLGYLDAGEIPPAFAYNEDWECEGCPMKLVCDIEAAGRKEPAQA
jgi:hypothetical protein